MGELKAYIAPTVDGTGLADYYLKSEADKVIAELEADCAYWKTMSRKCADDNEVMAKQRADAFKRERHHKYKRCLAMARGCRLRGRLFGACGLYEKELWALKWHKRWLELAEKFKEMK